MRKRILGHLTDKELTSKTINEIVTEYYVHKDTAYREFERRGLTPLSKEEPTFNVTIQDLKEIPFSRIVEREKTTVPLLHKYIYKTYGIKRKEVYKMYLETKKEKRNLEALSDEEIKKPCAYLVKTYGTNSKEIKKEREKRGMNLRENRFRLTHVSDEVLFNLKLNELQAKYSVSHDTISRERRRRRRKGENGKV